MARSLITGLRRFLGGLVVLALAIAAVLVWGVYRYTRSGDTETFYASNFEVVGYDDLGGQPGFKMAMQVVDGRWYLYVAHFWVSGWSIVDVTDPAHPRYVKFIAGPAGTSTINLQVANGLLVTALEKPATELLKYLPWDGYAWLLWRYVSGQLWLSPDGSFEEGVWVWNVREPENPVKVGEWHGGGTGTHRNFYDGGRYAMLAANLPGFRGHQLVVLDLADPARPTAVGRWADPEQDLTAAVEPRFDGYYLHGPAHVEGNRLYAPFGVAGAIIFDVSDATQPVELGRVNPFPEWGSTQGVHTFLPLPRRRLAIINTEAHDESCRPDPGPSYTAMVDIADEQNPHLLSFFPEPEPPPGAPYDSFCELGGRAGAHNQHHDNHQPHLFQSDSLTYLTTFSSGLRLYDTSDPEHVREIGYFIPPNPAERHGPFPTELVVQSEDVLVDARGYAYLTDKNLGLYIVRATAPQALKALDEQDAAYR